MEVESWHYISEGLDALYWELGIEDSFEKDNVYLQEAYNATENLWNRQFNSIKIINYVMIAEAPRYGSGETYFYNPEAEFSSFFWFDDLEAFSKIDSKAYLMLNQQKKEYVFKILRIKGFIIVDIFPFAFNDEDTCISYRKIGKAKYRKILKQSYPNYLQIKLRRVKDKSHNQTKIFYRYKFLKNLVDDYVRNKLFENQLIKNYEQIPCIGGDNMSLDRGLMRDIVDDFNLNV